MTKGSVVTATTDTDGDAGLWVGARPLCTTGFPPAHAEGKCECVSIKNSTHHSVLPTDGPILVMEANQTGHFRC